MLRFAPSPTGDLHISDLRVALFNYICSKQVGESFAVRIEDLDISKVAEGKDKEILGLLDLFGIEYETISYQSESKKRHQLMALQLINTKRAFNCFCSKEKLADDLQKAKETNKPYHYDGACENLSAEQTIDNLNPFSVRIKKPLTAIEFTDKIQGDQKFGPQDIDSFMVLTPEKLPTQIFASAVDDMISDISMVVSTEDHLLDSAREMAVRAALGYTKSVTYAHLPVILNSAGNPIGKNDDGWSVKSLLERGILPVSIVNYLLLLGNETSKELFDLSDALSFLDLAKIDTNSPTFEIEKLYAINKEHLKAMDDVELSRYVGFADADIGKAAKLFLDEANTTKDLKAKVAAIFSSKSEEGEIGPIVKQFKEILKNAPHFNAFSEMKDYIIQNSKVTQEEFSHAMRILLTGTTSGPDLEKLYTLIKNYIMEIIK